jgi:hypothetical protein
MKTRFRVEKIATALCLTGLSCCNGGSGLPALADASISTTSVRRVSTSEATGQQGQPPRIELSPGYGVNISFIPTGETVEKVWFDNPAFATLDVDGCLIGLGGEQQQSQNCQVSGATVLHLRRINPLDFPNLPKTNSTLLTVITHGPDGRRVYIFQVAKGGNTPQYYTVEVTPPTSTASTTRYRSVVESVTDWQLLNRGLTVAQHKRLVQPSQPLFGRIQNFLAIVKAGEQIESAARVSGISLNLVRRLEELGRAYNPVPVPAPVPSVPSLEPQNPSMPVRLES